MKNVERPVVVSVEWGYELHECPMAMRTWDRVRRGSPVRRVEPFWYDGERFTAEWFFNATGPGSLTVTYDGAGVGFDGTLADALISVDGRSVNWEVPT